MRANISEAKQPNMVNRERHELKNFIHVDFEDVLAEPSGAHSTNLPAKSYRFFQSKKNCGYM